MNDFRLVTKLGLFFVMVLFQGLICTCHDGNQDVVPYVPVNLILDIQTDLAHLGVGETAVIIPDGNGYGIIRFSNPKYPEIRLGQEVFGNGLILYRAAQYEFLVYDKTCTYQASTRYCSLIMGNNWLIPCCPCCQSEFVIPLDGAVKNGPAAAPLKPYRSFISSSELYLTN